MGTVTAPGAIDRAADAERHEVVGGGFDTALFTAAAIGPHDHVLDIGCGYGATTRRAARRAPRGHVVGNDVVEPVLERARAAAAAEGLGNVTFVMGDARVPPFPQGRFDVAVSRFGVMFFTDPVAAFANIGRALRPGGRLAFTTVGPPERNDLPALLAAVTGGRSAVPAVYSLADPERIADVLARAGFRDVTVAPVETEIAIGRDAAAAAEFVLAWGAFSDALDRSGTGAVEVARAALTRAARRFEKPGRGVRLCSTAWLVAAVRPA